jgi:hypothetical protein
VLKNQGNQTPLSHVGLKYHPLWGKRINWHSFPSLSTTRCVSPSDLQMIQTSPAVSSSELWIQTHLPGPQVRIQTRPGPLPTCRSMANMPPWGEGIIQRSRRFLFRTRHIYLGQHSLEFRLVAKQHMKERAFPFGTRQRAAITSSEQGTQVANSQRDIVDGIVQDRARSISGRVRPNC